MIISGGIFAFLLLTPEVSFAQTESGSFKYDGDLRSYKVFFPSDYSTNKEFPVVFYLHCYGFYGSWGASYTGLHRVADTLGYITVYPEAVENWNSGISYDNRLETPDVDDVGFISALIDTLDNRYSIDLERIYSTGFSNGGFMSLRLACELSDRIAAVASVGGALVKSIAANSDPMRNVPVLVIGGTDDVPPSSALTYWFSFENTVNHWVVENNCLEQNSVSMPDVDPADGCTVEKISYTNCDYNCNVLYYKVHGGGHTWPGGDAEKNPDGNTSMDINAGYEILKFFNEAQLTPASIESPKFDGQLSTYPNPFDRETIISFQLLKVSKVELKVYNSTGQEIRTFLFPNRNAGTHTIYWDGTNNSGDYVSGGLYMISLSTSDYHTTKKVIFMR